MRAEDAGSIRPFSLPRWISWVVAGEGVGFLAPTAGFALTSTLAATPWAAYVTMIVAGALEGALLGAAQAAALKGPPLAVPRLRWIAVTAAGAAFAWALGMLAPTLTDAGHAPDLTRPSAWFALAWGALLLLGSIPVAQWTVLRAVLPRAWRWVPLSMGAWLVGLVFTFLPSPFIDESTPPGVLAASYAVAGVAMAATVATVTGVGLRRMLPR